MSAVFIDTSVLIGGLIDFGKRTEAAQSVLAAVADQRIAAPKTAWHCCLEFYSVSTRLPKELRLSPEDAGRLIQEEILARFEVSQLPPESRPPFLRVAVADGVFGGRIYDAHIAEIARASGAERVVTENRRDFVTLLRHGVAVLTAAEFVEEEGLGS